MASIRPFKAIKPNPLYATGLIQTSPQVQSVAGDSHDADGLPVLKIALEIGARHRPETPEGQAKAFEDIRHTLHELLQQGLLKQDESPAMFIYEVQHKTYRQTGIWTLMDLDDYTNGTIKTHELTFADSVRRIKNYREHTQLEGSPILMTYLPNIAVNRIIAETIARQDHTSLGNEEAVHKLWRIEDDNVLRDLAAAFAQLKTVYLADGHHRLESSTRLAAEQRARGEAAFDTISSLYMAADQLRIQEFDRVVLPSEPLAKVDLLRLVNERFVISGSDVPVRPTETHNIGMCVNGDWFVLQPRDIPQGSFTSTLDAAILQDQLLAPVFGITNPVSDTRLKCVGSRAALGGIKEMITEHPEAIAFTLCALTVDELIRVADAGEILPPKSTWIDPKIPYGLLLYRHSIS